MEKIKNLSLFNLDQLQHRLLTAHNQQPKKYSQNVQVLWCFYQFLKVNQCMTMIFSSQYSFSFI